MEWNYNTSTVPYKKSKTVSFASSIIKNIVACCCRFPVKLICCVPLGPVSSACYWLKSIGITL